MLYGIRVIKEFWVYFDDGSKHLVSESRGWYLDMFYKDVESAQKSLAIVYDVMRKESFEITMADSISFAGFREFYLDSECFAPCNTAVHVAYIIKER